MESIAHQLLLEIDSWQPSIHALLRSSGLPPDEAERAAKTVMKALSNTLRSRQGQWLLQVHDGGQSESAWSSAGDNLNTLRVRMDRSFFAGLEPLTTGDDALWIVDFKTADRTGNIESYLEGERERYTDQLQTYADVRRHALPDTKTVMLALYYPLMDRLIYWPDDRTQDRLAVTSARLETGSMANRGQLHLFSGR